MHSFDPKEFIAKRIVSDRHTFKPRAYLDVDGVLNSDVGNKIASEKYPEDDKLLSENLLKHKHLLYKWWYPEAVTNFRRILETIKPEIYIQSTWKNHFELKDFREFFEYWNLDHTLIKDIVPRYKFSSERFHDLAWHIDGKRIGSDNVAPCYNYVVLDDMDMRYVFEDRDIFKTRQVCTNPEFGITKEDADLAIHLFESNREHKLN